MSELTAIQNVAVKTVAVSTLQNSAKPNVGEVSGAGENFATLVSDVAKPKAGITAAEKAINSANITQKFEAMVASQLFGTMLKTMPGDTFGSGMSGDIYKSMFADALGEQIAKHGGLGIAGLAENNNASRLAK